MANLKIAFLVRGISNRKPNRSVIKPGMINNKAANAIEAPDINSLIGALF